MFCQLIHLKKYFIYQGSIFTYLGMSHFSFHQLCEMLAPKSFVPDVRLFSKLRVEQKFGEGMSQKHILALDNWKMISELQKLPT